MIYSELETHLKEITGRTSVASIGWAWFINQAQRLLDIKGDWQHNEATLYKVISEGEHLLTFGPSIRYVKKIRVCEASESVAESAITSVDSIVQISDSTKSWTPDEWIRCFVSVSKGSSVFANIPSYNLAYPISDNDSDSLIISPETWSTDEYPAIVSNDTYRVLTGDEFENVSKVLNSTDLNKVKSDITDSSYYNQPSYWHQRKAITKLSNRPIVELTPISDGTYILEIEVKAYTQDIDASIYTETYWSINHPDILINAVMFCIETHLRNSSSAKDFLSIVDEMLFGHSKDDLDRIMGDINPVMHG